MNTKGQMLQDPFLNILRKEHVPVSITKSSTISYGSFRLPYNLRVVIDTPAMSRLSVWTLSITTIVIAGFDSARVQ